MALHSNTDWDTKVVIGRKTGPPKVARDEATVNAARRAGASIDASKKQAINSSGAAAGPDHQRIAKLDRENDVAPPAKVKPSVGKAMSQARLELKLTQKDLANATSEKPSVINDYEAGRATPSPAILAKFERILKVKLRGENIGSPLQSRGKKS
ncbi:multi protein bridging factor 1-domain-containing protein [Phakopsora pachyrhizi]|uniref:Multi protein bridging factor 1-domain-containing protein n=1 Tax=Phakopsora pachyrhizi TaxID=170000 RepID=A0AAV0ASA9_PHAPC|nr:multi protein bridging factor 1-domain-containing protein [Phakopsora pachyrhizi]CAH7670996.1 multi protein bridging factor 1-domain-containing protein [Phakopsora pachyrhizi]